MSRLPLLSLLLTSVVVLTGCICGFNSTLTENGQASAQIVLQKDADVTEKYAAQELQFWVKKITGAELPICCALDDDKLNLVVGGGLIDFPEDVAAIGETDGFAVRRHDGNVIRISGNRSKGTLHGVYAFLEENTDIIWLRPNEEVGTVYGEMPTLRVKNASFRSVPASRLRGIGFTIHGTKTEPEWAARNRQNAHWRSGIDKPDKLGNDYPVGGGGHGLRMYLHPNKYFESNPEYFVMLNGKRTPSGQLCFMNPAIIKPYVKNLREYLNTIPSARGVNLSCEDNWTVCECDKCLAPIKLKDGKVIEKDDVRFRSAQYFLFLNKVAQQLKESHPQVIIQTYAYYHTAVTPPFKLEDNIRISSYPYDRVSRNS